jgi:hypothetical protein
MRSQCCLCVCLCSPINYLMPEPIFMKLGMYIMALEPISKTYIINPSVSRCVYMFIPRIVARQRLGKQLPAAMSTGTIEKLLDASFVYAFISYQRRVGD